MFNAVHAPMQALEADKVKSPGRRLQDPMREIYTGMMTAMDRNVGRTLDHLDSLKLSDNTMVLFLNDNGGGGHPQRYEEHSRNYADNAPFRGFKNDLYEGGIRPPFYIKWPGQIQSGSKFPAMVSRMDIFPPLEKTLIQPFRSLDQIQYCISKNLCVEN